MELLQEIIAIALYHVVLCRLAKVNGGDDGEVTIIGIDKGGRHSRIVSRATLFEWARCVQGKAFLENYGEKINVKVSKATRDTLYEWPLTEVWCTRERRHLKLIRSDELLMRPSCLGARAAFCAQVSVLARTRCLYGVL